MSVSLYTQSIEDADITLTNCGAGSDGKLLQWRDNRVLGVDSPDDGNIKYVEIDFKTSTTIDYVILGNLYSGYNIKIVLQYDDTGWNTAETLDNQTPDNENFFITVSPSRTSTKFRLQFDAGSAPSPANWDVDLSCVFMGEAYTFPVNYQQDNNRGYMRRYEKMTDFYGYGYSHLWNTATKQIYDFGFHLTEAQLTTLNTQFEYFNYGAKRFFIKDTLVDANYHLAEWAGDPELIGDNIASGYYNVPFKAVEL